MARDIQEGAESMDRRSRNQSERELAASNRAAEAAAMGTIAGSMILGLLSPHQASAKNDGLHHDPGVPAANEQGQHRAEFPADADQNAMPAPGAPSHAFSSQGESAASRQDEGAAMVPSVEVDSGHRFDTGQADRVVGTHAESGFLSSEPSYAGHHAIAGNDAVADASPASVAGLFDTVTNGFENLGVAIDDAVSSVTQSLTATFGNLSATFADLTHSLANPLGFGIDNPVEHFLNNPTLASPGDLLFTNPVDLASESSAVSPALTLLDSLPPAILGAPNGGLEQNYGSPDTFSSMHSSIGSFGDLSQPIHIGFAGQPIGHMPDAHDFGTHGTGSILHGFA